MKDVTHRNTTIPASVESSSQEVVENAGSLKQLDATLDRVPVGVFHADRYGHILYANQHLRELLGYGREEILTRMFRDLTRTGDAKECQRLWQAVLDGSIAGYERETAFVRQDGSLIVLRLRMEAIGGADDSPVILVGVVDGGSRTLAREHLAIRDRFLAALEASQTGTFRWEIDSIEPEWDENLERLFGRGPAESLGELLDVVYPDDVSGVVETFWACLGEGGEFQIDFRVLLGDGSIRWIHGRGRTVSDEDGTPVYMTGACTDVTDRVRAEAAVRASEARLRRIVDSGMIGVYEWWGGGEIVQANDAFLELLGYTRADVEAGRLNVHQFAVNGGSGAEVTKIEPGLDRAALTPRETEFRARDGRIIPVLQAQARLDGSEHRAIAICLDMTERKRIEQERERLLVVEHEARAAAERAIQQRDDVLAIVAHDLRNPISTIQMSMTSLQTLDLEDNDRKRQYQIVQRAAATMEGLIRDLLDVSRIEAGTFAVRRGTVDVPKLIREMIDLFQESARRQEVEFVVSMDPEIGQISGDFDRLEQALSNLISNAIKFSRAGGSVTLEVRRQGDSVEIAVVDSGPGIDAKDLPHIFDRFWQVDRTSRAGAGLGLVIARGIIESHGGRLEVTSEVGTGTTFRCTLPVGPVDSPEAGDVPC